VIRTIEVEVYSPDGAVVLMRKRQSAPPGKCFRDTDGVAASMVQLLDAQYPGNCWRIMEIPDGAKKVKLKFVWNWDEPGALQTAMAVEQKHHPGRPSRKILAMCKDLAQERQGSHGNS